MKTKTSILSRIIVYSVILNTLLLNNIFAQKTFTDQNNIPSWGLNPVSILVEANVINGNADGSLAPWRNINRAEFLKILVTATDTPLATSAINTFPDVPEDAWFTPYVKTAVQKGWAKGYPDGTFKPGNLINRAEIAKLLSEAWNIPLSTNATDTDWFDQYVRALNTENNLPYGATLENFQPAKTPSRIEVFTQLERLWTKANTVQERIIPAIVEDEDTIAPESEEAAAETANSETGTTTSTTTGNTDQPTDNTTDNSNTASDTTSETDTNTGNNDTNTGSSDTSNSNDDTNTNNDNTFTPPPIIKQPTVEDHLLEIDNLSPESPQDIVPGQGGITAMSFEVVPREGNPTITAFTFTHSGSAPVTNFSRMWLYDEDDRISEEIIPQSPIATLNLEEPLVLKGTKKIYLKVDTGSNALPNHTSRWSISAGANIETDSQTHTNIFPLHGQPLDIYPEQ